MKRSAFLRLLAHAAETYGSDACWPWPHGTNGRYGKVLFGGRETYAHRIAWEIANGCPAPEELLVCHSCDNPICFNPGHLWLGTDLDNMLDMKEKGRARSPYLGRTHCKRGHELTPETTRTRRICGFMVRECRACVNLGLRTRRRAAKTRCKHGHPLTAENVTLSTGATPGVQYRRCRICMSAKASRIAATRDGRRASSH